jgi:hypothetical protein
LALSVGIDGLNLCPVLGAAEADGCAALAGLDANDPNRKFYPRGESWFSSLNSGHGGLDRARLARSVDEVHLLAAGLE